MRRGLPSHPSLETCSESLSWNQSKGLNSPAEEFVLLGASHNSHRGKHPWPRDPPPLQKGAIRDRMFNLSDRLILPLTSNARALDSGL